jgi:hypothetical protein
MSGGNDVSSQIVRITYARAATTAMADSKQELHEPQWLTIVLGKREMATVDQYYLGVFDETTRDHLK